MNAPPHDTPGAPAHKSNALAHASSSYLRSAMHQPVAWNEWGEAAFARAMREDRPILLDIGAVWCHWCHVMDRESYEDPGTASIINQHYVAIKVDRDERPDVDSRYQAAVAALGASGGWPLTVVLTPQGVPFFGGTYFPKEDGYGRPSLQRVLRTMAEVYRDRKAEVADAAENVRRAMERNESISGHSSGLQDGLVEAIVQSALRQYDAQHGGFGAQPKFPHPTALDLLLDQAMRTGDGATRQAAVGTLRAMAKGGVYDQLAGGFHRYSVDDRWVVPHFEKMAYDNAGLLRNYLHCFQSFGHVEDAHIALDIVRWMDTTLCDREHGGFYASQDADISLEDDGGFFTWTRDEAASVLTPEEMAVAALYYDIGEVGEMHHDPAKNVLYIAHTLQEVAQALALTESAVAQRLAAAKEKLLAARMRRQSPFVDKTVYTNWNAMCVSAYLEAWRTLGPVSARKTALLSLDRSIREAWRPDGTLRHVTAAASGKAQAQATTGLLDDYAMLGHACLDAWEATASLQYFLQAEAVARAMVERFYDTAEGGFFDTETSAHGTTALGVLGTRRKPFQDSPAPAGGPLAASLLLRLESLNGNADWRKKAQQTLESVAGIVEHFGLYAGAYGLALQRFLSPPVQVCIIGEDAVAEQLMATAIARYAVNKTVLRPPRSVVQQRALPPLLAETLPHLPSLKGAASFAVVCAGNSCLPPAYDAEGLFRVLGRAM